MLARLSAALLLTLTACASHEGPAPAPTPTSEPEPRAEVTVAIASVQLIQDCPDPATDATPPTAAAPTDAAQPSYAPPPPASGPRPATNDASQLSAKRRAPTDGTWTPPCVQSTMQLSLANTGARAGTIEIKALRLLDAKTQRELSPIVTRKPSEWNDEGTYRPWDQQVAPSTTAKAAYRLSDPDWDRIQTTLGDPENLNIYAHPFILELDIAVDGRSQTVRSPEFVRQPVHMVVT